MQPQDSSREVQNSRSLPPLWSEPAPPPERPPKKRPVMLIMAIILVTLGTAGAGAFVWWQSNRSMSEHANQKPTLTKVDSKQLFLSAVENHMNTPYIVQKAEQTLNGTSGKTIIKLYAVSDFSNPVDAKTKLSYTTEDDKKSESSKAFGREQIAIGSALYAKIPDGTAVSSPLYKTNQWYVLQVDNPLASLVLDPFDVAAGVNTPLGQVPVGKFTEAQRKELMAFIKEENTYTLSNQKTETFDGKEVLRVTVKSSSQKSDELNTNVARLLGIKNTLADRAPDTPIIETFEAWVDQNNKKLKKVHFSISDRGKELGSSTFSFEYPAVAPAITVPIGATNAPRQ